jgi:hypothetical protein
VRSSAVRTVVGIVAAVPAGFLAGFVVRRVPRLREWRGVPSGLAATVLTFPASALFEIAVALPLRRLVAESTAPLSEYPTRLEGAPIRAVFLGCAALTTTFWLTLPLGPRGGYIRESTQTESTAWQ